MKIRSKSLKNLEWMKTTWNCEKLHILKSSACHLYFSHLITKLLKVIQCFFLCLNSESASTRSSGIEAQDSVYKSELQTNLFRLKCVIDEQPAGATGFTQIFFFIQFEQLKQILAGTHPQLPKLNWNPCQRAFMLLSNFISKQEWK